MSSPDPYSLIESTARRIHGQKLRVLALPALPPVFALAGAWFFGRLPIEITTAATIAFGFLFVHAVGLAVGKEEAGSFLDRRLGAKDHFLTLATLAPSSPKELRAVVESGAIELASVSGPPALPPSARRPLGWSVALSLAGFALLWLLPDFPLAHTGDPLERIAAELAASEVAADRDLAKEIREVLKAIKDPALSPEQKQEKVKEVIQKLDKDSPSRSASRSSGGKHASQQKSDKGEEKKGSGSEKGNGAKAAGQNPSQQGEAEGGGSNSLKGEAKSELAKISDQLGGQQNQKKSSEGKKGQEKSDASGGGLKGPKQSDSAEQKDGKGSEPSGDDPNKPGNQQKPGESAKGEAKQPQEKGDQQSAQGAGNRGQGGEGGSAGQKPIPSGDGQPAERYYRAGEGPGGSKLSNGNYVRVRVPGDDQPKRGTEIVAKPGDADPETPYGNAPLPVAGAPGEVAIDQPQPLEYREALSVPQK